jgi:CDP-diglyceride synthetase
MGLGFAAYLVMLWSRSPWLVVPLALGVSALLLWLIVFIQRSPNVTLRAKRTGWLYLLFVLTCGLKVLAVIGPLLRH